MTKRIALPIACLCLMPSIARTQETTEITSQEKAAFSVMFTDSKKVFDQAEKTARAAAAQVDINTTHENLRTLESITDSAIRHETALRVPPTLQSKQKRLLVSLRELKTGTKLQLSYWSNGDLSVIEKGQPKLEAGIRDLNSFVNEMNSFLSNRSPSAGAPAAAVNDTDSTGIYILVALGAVLYFVPAIVGRNKRNSGAIFILNLLLGWSVIGWIIALVWACTKDDPQVAATP